MKTIHPSRITLLAMHFLAQSAINPHLSTVLAQGTGFTRPGRIRNGTTTTAFTNSPTGKHS